MVDHSVIPIGRGVEGVLAPSHTATSRVSLAIRFVSMLVIPILVGAASGFFGAQHIKPLFGAESEIIFGQRDRGEIAEQYLSTQALIAQSRTVLQPIARTAGIPLETVQENLRVDFPKGSAIMRVQYADENATRAFEVLQAIVDRYMTLTGESSRADQAMQQLLVPPFKLEKPVRPKPLQLAAIGGLLGLAIAIAGIAVMVQVREKR